MKKIFTLIFLLAVCGFLNAQDLFSKQWNVEVTSDNGGHPSEFRRYFFGNDSIIKEDNVYWPLIESSDETGDEGITYGYFREEGYKLYKYVTENDDDFKFYDIPLGEIIYFDFGLQEGDSIKSYIGDYDIVVTKVDSFELLDGSMRKAIHLQCVDANWLSNAIWVDGIGALTHGFEGVRLLCGAPEGDWSLKCYYENSNILYKNPDSNECFLVSTKDLDSDRVSIYPNPSKDILVIEGLDGEYTFEIINQIGIKMKASKNRGNSINIENLPMGTYYLSIQSEDNFITKIFSKI
jgi:hypothetical protein